MRRLLLAILIVFALIAFPPAPAADASGVQHALRMGGERLSTSSNWGGYAVESSLSSPASGSAEWIQGAPWSGGVRPLANFGTMTFTGASATLGGHAGAINDPAWQSDPITMQGSSGPKATPGALDSTGTSFTMTWSSAT